LEKCRNIKFRVIRPVGADLFHADKGTDRRTDSHDATSSSLVSIF